MLALMLALAACGAGAANTPPARGASPSARGATSTAPTAASSPTSAAPTRTVVIPVGTAAAQAGTADVCGEPADVTSQAPASVPVYPGATLHVSELNGSDGFYGYCTTDSVSSVAAYYAQALPGAGWSGVQSQTIIFVRQLTATRDSSAITVNIEPSTLQSGLTDITIEIQG